MGVTLLLDTHVVLWLWGQPSRLHAAHLERLGDPANRLLISAASAIEVATKTRLGKLPVGELLVPLWSSRVDEMAAEELPISAAHSLLAGSMRWEHRDPFDRLLAAQALIEGATLVTNDASLSTLPGLRTLDPTSSPAHSESPERTATAP